MAKQEKFTLTLDFNVERAKLQEVGSILGKDMEKGLRGTKTIEYFNTLKSSVSEFSKSVGLLYNELSKPLTSKSQAKELASNIESAFKGLDSKLLSLQGNIGKTFNSIGNADALKRIRQLGDEIDKMMADYQAASQLFNKSKSLGNKTELKSQLSAASKELDILKKKQGELTTEEKAKQKELEKSIKDINKALEEKLRLTEQINQIQAENGVSSQAEFNSAIGAKVEEQQGLINGSISVQDAETLKDALAQIRDIIKDIMATANATGPKISENISQIENQRKEAEEQAKTFKSVMKELGIPMLSLQGIVRSMKQIISYSYEYIKNLDKALTEISIVSGKTRSEVIALTDTFIELSSKTGMAIDDIAKASTIFYQQGLGDAAVKQLTEWTAIFAKISNETVETAADQITAAMNGFGFQYSQVEDVVDKMSVLAAHSAASIDELATAMSKAASQANQAGLSFDEYNAYLATMIEATREAPENIGTSLKTIMSRMQQIKKGENTEDDTTVNDVEKALKTVGIELRNAEGQLKDLDEVLGELGPKWNMLDRNTQAYLGTIIAGTRQQSRFITLMQNWDRVLELTKDSENSAGAATRMHQAAMEGLDASLNNLTNAWQKLISNLANGDSFKWLIDALAGIVKWFGEGNTLLKVFTVAITLFNAKTLITNLSLAAQGKEYKNLDSAIGTVIGKVKTFGGNLADLTKKTSVETAEITRQAQEVNNLARSYDNLAASKQNAANSGGTGTTPTVPTNSNNTGGPIEGQMQLDLPDADTLKNVNNETGKLNGGLKGLGGKLKTAAGNVTNLIGCVQTGIMVGLWAASLAETISDWLITTASEMKEKAQKAYDETQKEIDSRLELIKTVESNIETYERLSKKLNKSAEEVNELAKAADELAKAAPGALIGYDANGNAIIDTAAAKGQADDAKRELADYAKVQMGNIGNLARADLREIAEKNVASSSNYDTVQGVSTAGMAVGYGSAAAIATFGAVNGWNPVGWGALIVAGIVAIGSTIAYGVSSFQEQAAIDAEELRLAQKKANEVYKEYNEDLLKNMSYITDYKLKDRKIDGADKNARMTMASYIGNEWLQKESNDLYNKLVNKEINEEQYEEAYQELGEKWSKVLDRIDDRTLASAYNKVNTLADNIGDKTYAAVESAIEKIIKDDMGISEDDPLFQVIKDAFFKAAYSGTDMAVYSVVKDLEKRKQDALFAGGYDEGSDEYKEIEERYNKAIDNAKNKLSGQELTFLDNIDVTDNVGLFNMVLDQYGDTIKDGLAKSTEAACVNSIAVLASYRDEAQKKLQELADEVAGGKIEDIDYDSLTAEQQVYYKKWTGLAEDAANSIEKAWNSMKISIDIPWESLWEKFEKLEERALNCRETLAGMLSGDGIDKGQWQKFTEQLDHIDFSNFDTSQLLQFSGALDTIAGSLKVVDGQIYANGEALQTVAQLEEAAMQASIQSAKTELINKQLELEAAKAIIDAQIATLEWKIAEAEGSEQASQLKTSAEEAWGTASNKINTVFLQNQEKVSEAMVTQFASAFTAIAQKYNQLQTAMSDGSITQDELNNLASEWKNVTKDLNLDSYAASLDKELNKPNGLNNLKNQLSAAKKASAEYAWQISNINLKLAQLDSGLWGGANGVASGKKKEELEQYIGKLKKIYNIENRILTLEHRLGTLESYEDIAKGSTAAGFFSEQIDLTNQLLDQYQFLTQEQKRFTNGIQEDIKNAGFGNVFSFDKFGQIIINWEEYNKLQDTAVQGQKSLKEQADEWYEKQTEAIEKTREDFDKYIDTLKKALDLQNKMYDAYITMETKAADAVKEIYQKILNTKLEAIDKEKEAIEDLRKAREDARKDQENAKAVTGLQTNIQRAMMDTSGASDVALIKAQQDLDDKLSEIAEDKYSEMLDDIITKLEDEKEALQDEFDALWENMDWLFSWLDEEVMRDEERLTELLTQTDEWNTSSEAQRNRLMQDWDTNYKRYMEGLKGGKTIGDIWNNITTLQEKTVEMDNVLKQQIAYTGNTISTAVSNAVKSAYNSGYSNGASSVKTGSTGLTGTKIEGDGVPTADVNNYKDDSKPDSKFKVGDRLKSAAGWIRPYSLNSNGTFTQKGILSTMDVYDVTVDEVKYSNGTYYYKVRDGNKTEWFNGFQLQKYATGGLVENTGLAWLDGTKEHPEMVLNPLQTEHFIQFSNALEKLTTTGAGVSNATSNINIDTISFNVESMSSEEDGEKAFNMFVAKFKEIGSQSGLSIGSFKNNL